MLLKSYETRRDETRRKTLALAFPWNKNCAVMCTVYRIPTSHKPQAHTPVYCNDTLGRAGSWHRSTLSLVRQRANQDNRNKTREKNETRKRGRHGWWSSVGCIEHAPQHTHAIAPTSLYLSGARTQTHFPSVAMQAICFGCNVRILTSVIIWHEVMSIHCPGSMCMVITAALPRR